MSEVEWDYDYRITVSDICFFQHWTLPFMVLVGIRKRHMKIEPKICNPMDITRYETYLVIKLGQTQGL